MNSRPSGRSSYASNVPSLSGGSSSWFKLLIEISVSSVNASSGMSRVNLPSELVILPPLSPIIALTILAVSSSSLHDRKPRIRKNDKKTDIYLFIA